MPDTAPPAVKPGWQTSEAWLSVAPIGLALIESARTLDGWQRVAALGIAAVVACVYAMARAMVKRA